jgi:RimK family alpha-L-glutamate ligase
MVTIVAHRRRSTNDELAEAWSALGVEARVLDPQAALREAEPGEVVLNRLDVLETLDGIEPGLDAVAALAGRGAAVLNRPDSMRAAHDKLETAVRLDAAGVPHPHTVHVTTADAVVELCPPVVVKPRYGSWGRDVFRCTTREELADCLAAMKGRSWFRRHGALVQELVPPCGYDLRLVVAGGHVVGAAERAARPGEWRTNVSLGGSLRPARAAPESWSLGIAAAAALDTDLVGVDLAPIGDGWVVLELNGAADFDERYRLVGASIYGAIATALGLRPQAHDRSPLDLSARSS